jgi:predicted TIM-barrel fold metal-dependent hydrolase
MGTPSNIAIVDTMISFPHEGSGQYYSTAAFAPRHYPQEIIGCANTRGAHKIIYGGYFPMGLRLERIFSDMPHVPFKDEVWPKFLSENARRVLKIGK